MIRRNVRDDAVRYDRMRGGRARDLNFEIDAELIEDEIGRQKGFDVSRPSKIGHAEAEMQLRTGEPLHSWLVATVELRIGHGNVVLNAQRVNRTGRLNFLDHAQIRKSSCAEVVMRELRHRKDRSVDPSRGYALS